MGTFYSIVTLMLLYIVQAKSQECDGHPPMHPFDNDCCKVTFAMQQEQCLERIKEQWNEFRQSNNKNSSQTSDMCAANCVLNDNVITSDNKVNSQELKVDLEKFLGAEWQSLIPNIIETCKNHIDNFNPNGHGPHGPPGNGPPGNEPSGNGPPRNGTRGNGQPHHGMMNCNKGKEKLFFCLREQFLTNCPDSSWKNDEECNSMRSYLKNCPFEKRGHHGGPRRQP